MRVLIDFPTYTTVITSTFGLFIELHIRREYANIFPFIFLF